VIDETLLDAMDKMAKAFDHVQAQFSSVRTGRANASFVDKLMVDYYGAMVPLQQLATFQVPEARQLVIKPHDRGAIPAIEKSIQTADLGVAPSNDGVIIRLTFPMLTEERRKEYVKLVKNMAEDGRVSLRTRDRRKGRRHLQGRTRACREGTRQDDPRARRAG
jgi:ribosome recycling factor